MKHWKYIKYVRWDGKIVYAIANIKPYGEFCLVYIKNRPPLKFRKTSVTEISDEEYLASSILES